MRTPNTQCVICSTPLYRRPGELLKVRYAACMAHRNEAARRFGVTDAQEKGLQLGRRRGTNNRTGYQHRDESKLRTSQANKEYWASHPDELRDRGKKLRGVNHYRWNGGVSKLNASIRRMTENRRWMDAVKQRDGHKCVRCGSTDRLESHHLIELADLIQKHNIQSREDARNTPDLWDVSNGETLCEKCHYKHHGRNYADRREALSANA